MPFSNVIISTCNKQQCEFFNLLFISYWFCLRNLSGQQIYHQNFSKFLDMICLVINYHLVKKNIFDFRIQIFCCILIQNSSSYRRLILHVLKMANTTQPSLMIFHKYINKLYTNMIIWYISNNPKLCLYLYIMCYHGVFFMYK